MYGMNHLTNSVVMLELWLFVIKWFGKKTFFCWFCCQTWHCALWWALRLWNSDHPFPGEGKVRKQTTSSDLNRNTYSPRTILGALKQNLWLVIGSQRTQSLGRFWSMSATSLRISPLAGWLHNVQCTSLCYISVFSGYWNIVYSGSPN